MITRKAVAGPLFLMSIGLGWILWNFQVVVPVDWRWTLPLGALGVISFLLGGFNKVTFIGGFFLIVAFVLSIIRQIRGWDFMDEMPYLILVASGLWLIAVFMKLPTPSWFRGDSGQE